MYERRKINQSIFKSTNIQEALLGGSGGMEIIGKFTSILEGEHDNPLTKIEKILLAQTYSKNFVSLLRKFKKNEILKCFNIDINIIEECAIKYVELHKKYLHCGIKDMEMVKHILINENGYERMENLLLKYKEFIEGEYFQIITSIHKNFKLYKKQIVNKEIEYFENLHSDGNIIHYLNINFIKMINSLETSEEKKEILDFLNLIRIEMSNLYKLSITPNFNMQELFGCLTSTIDLVSKETNKQRNKRNNLNIDRLLKDKIELFTNNFHKYYKIYLLNRNPISIIDSFISDVLSDMKDNEKSKNKNRNKQADHATQISALKSIINKIRESFESKIDESPNKEESSKKKTEINKSFGVIDELLDIAQDLINGKEESLDKIHNSEENTNNDKNEEENTNKDKNEEEEKNYKNEEEENYKNEEEEIEEEIDEENYQENEDIINIFKKINDIIK